MKRILIVEDDALLNKTLAYNLASDGYGIASAMNAKNAADKLGSAEYDLVLLDINLPDGSGGADQGLWLSGCRHGFLEPAKRLPNGYQVFCVRHIYQIRVCRLVFGGFVNRRLRKISKDVLRASKNWNLEAYRQAANRYLHAVEEDIRRTKLAVDIVVDKLQETREDGLPYTKKQAAMLAGVTPETIRNGERNGLFRQRAQYEKRHNIRRQEYGYQ